MTILILLVNLLAVGTGAAVIALAYRMDRECRLPAVRDYLVFLVLAVVSGFFDWIVFNLVKVLVPGISMSDIDAIYHVFWDLIGFPCAMAAAAWLMFALAGFLNIRLDRKRKAALAAPFLFMGLLSVAWAALKAGNVGLPLGAILWPAFIFALPLIHLLLLGAAFGLARRLQDQSRTVVRQFIILLFLGLFVWYVLSLVPSRIHPSYHISIIWFYLALLPPTLLLRRRLALFQRQEAPADFSPEALAPLFDRFPFTEREKDVLVLLLKGKSYKDIQADLFISLQTVKNYASRIYGKLAVRNRVELANLIRNLIRAK